MVRRFIVTSFVAPKGNMIPSWSVPGRLARNTCEGGWRRGARPSLFPSRRSVPLKAMAHDGQYPGTSRRISRCIGQLRRSIVNSICRVLVGVEAWS